MRKHYRFIHDAGHGWLEVHRDDLAELGLSEGDLSEFSYKNGGFFYLEEDCDAGLFIGYHDSIMGFSPKYSEHDHGNWSRIRNFQRCKPTLPHFRFQHMRQMIGTSYQQENGND